MCITQCTGGDSQKDSCKHSVVHLLSAFQCFCFSSEMFYYGCQHLLENNISFWPLDSVIAIFGLTQFPNCDNTCNIVSTSSLAHSNRFQNLPKLSLVYNVHCTCQNKIKRNHFSSFQSISRNAEKYRNPEIQKLNFLWEIKLRFCPRKSGQFNTSGSPVALFVPEL